MQTSSFEVGVHVSKPQVSLTYFPVERTLCCWYPSKGKNTLLKGLQIAHEASHAPKKILTCPGRFIDTMSLPTSSQELPIIKNETLNSTSGTLNTGASLSQTASQKQPSSVHAQTTKSDKLSHALQPTQKIRKKEGGMQPGNSSNVRRSGFAKAEVDHMLDLIDNCSYRSVGKSAMQC